MSTRADEARAALDVLNHLCATSDDVRLPLGLAHGDWTPWNVAWHKGTPWVWDWEYADFDVPIGMDVLQHAFQVELVRPGASVEQIVAEVDAAAKERLHWVDVGESARRLLASVYLVDRLVRQLEQGRDSDLWDERLHPGLVQALTRR